MYGRQERRWSTVKITDVIREWEEAQRQAAILIVREGGKVVATTKALGPEELDAWLAEKGYDDDQRYELEVVLPPEMVEPPTD
jgi:hypothetical protein